MTIDGGSNPIPGGVQPTPGANNTNQEATAQASAKEVKKEDMTAMRAESPGDKSAKEQGRGRLINFVA